MHMIALLLLLLLANTPVWANENALPSPGPGDKCPVCGMFVAKYPDFLCRVVLRDGSSAFFDGPKDMFKFYRDKRHYLPAKAEIAVDALYVTDYYELTILEAKNAWFVVGSDVRGPMGRELIPFSKKAAAQEFLTDHQGKRILRFDDITPELLGDLD